MTERPILFSGPMVRKILADEKWQTRRTVGPLPAAPRHLGSWEAGTVGGAGCFTIAKGERVPAPSRASLSHSRTGTTVVSKYQVGDILWVKETWRVVGWDDTGTGYAWVQYHADPEPRPRVERRLLVDNDIDWIHRQCQRLERQGAKEVDTPEGKVLRLPDGTEQHWRPSIYMERWASRISLEVTGVRAERLQDITEEDARSEGTSLHVGCPCEGDAEEPGPHIPLCRWNMKDWPGETPLGVDDEHRMAFAALWESINGERAPWAANPWVWVVSFRRVS